MDGFKPTGIFKPTELPKSSPETILSPEGERDYVERWELDTDVNSIEPKSLEVGKMLQAAGWDGDDLDHAVTGFKELYANAIIHGNLGVSKPADANVSVYIYAQKEQQDHPEKMKKKIIITFNVVDATTFSFTIQDEGEGFDPAKVPNPILPENLLKQSGRSLAWMKIYYGFSSVVHNDGGRKVTAEKRRGEKSK